MNSYKVYKHTSPSGKIYIGITQQDIKKRWQNGYGYANNNKFMNAIKKYGWDNFEHEVLFDNLTQQQAENIEIELIKKYDSIKNGYNIRTGGCTSLHSDETKKRMSEIAKINNNHLRLNTPEANKKKIPYGRVLTEETKRKIGDSHRGINSVSAKSVKQIELDGTLIKIWDCIMDIEREVGFKNTAISRCCKGKRPTAYGYKWEYVNG